MKISIESSVPEDILIRFPVLNALDSSLGAVELARSYKEKNANLQVCYDIVKEFAPKRIAEIGVRCGYSAWAMMQAAPEARFIGYDNYSYKPREICQCASEYMLRGYDTEIMEVDTQETTTLVQAVRGKKGFPQAYPKGRPVGRKVTSTQALKDIDLFHVDGDHSFKGAYHDLELALKTLSKDGKILVDDTSLKDVGQACVDFIWVHNEYEIRILEDDLYYGKWLIQKKGTIKDGD
jgi:hypothetical protein